MPPPSYRHPTDVLRHLASQGTHHFFGRPLWPLLLRGRPLSAGCVWPSVDECYQARHDTRHLRPIPPQKDHVSLPYILWCTLVHFGAVVADAPSPLSTPRSAAGQAQLRLGKPLRMKCRASPVLLFMRAGKVVSGTVGIARATVPFHGSTTRWRRPRLSAKGR